jgi:hypothetical protein
VVPEVYVRYRQLVVFMENDVESIGKCEFLEFDARNFGLRSFPARGSNQAVPEGIRAHIFTILSKIKPQKPNARGERFGPTQAAAQWPEGYDKRAILDM